MKDEEIFDDNPLDAANGDNSEDDSVNEAPSSAPNIDNELRINGTAGISDVISVVNQFGNTPERYCNLHKIILNNLKDEKNERLD